MFVAGRCERREESCMHEYQYVGMDETEGKYWLLLLSLYCLLLRPTPLP